MAKRGRTISDVVHEMMASLPETEEFISHGAPTFRAGGKVFATYTLNHHGDGRVALNLMAPRGAQAALVKMRPSVYFVPPYVGPGGWIGVELDKGLDWASVRDHAIDAYEMVAPRRLLASLDRNFRVKPPTRKLSAEEIDPLAGKAAKAILKKLAAICSALPEAVPGTMFGTPVWRAGKRAFAIAHHYTGRLRFSFWVGVARQPRLTKDSRYRVAPYMGHNGWIDLDVNDFQDWHEIKQLVLDSYRHFALQRMLKKLDTSASLAERRSK